MADFISFQKIVYAFHIDVVDWQQPSRTTILDFVHSTQILKKHWIRARERARERSKQQHQQISLSWAWARFNRSSTQNTIFICLFEWLSFFSFIHLDFSLHGINYLNLIQNGHGTLRKNADSDRDRNILVAMQMNETRGVCVMCMYLN